MPFDILKWNNPCGAFSLVAGFRFEAQLTFVLAAPLAVITVITWVFLRAPIILRDIHQTFNAFHPHKRHGKPFGESANFIISKIAPLHS